MWILRLVIRRESHAPYSLFREWINSPIESCETEDILYAKTKINFGLFCIWFCSREMVSSETGREDCVWHWVRPDGKGEAFVVFCRVWHLSVL